MRFGVIESRPAMGLEDAYLCSGKEEAMERARHVWDCWTEKEQERNSVQAVEVDDAYDEKSPDDCLDWHVSRILWNGGKDGN